jgi:hypothetical protein
MPDRGAVSAIFERIAQMATQLGRFTPSKADSFPIREKNRELNISRYCPPKM